jgi:hypothetical protein
LRFIRTAWCWKCSFLKTTIDGVPCLIILCRCCLYWML